jgi:hypothetical protein
VPTITGVWRSADSYIWVMMLVADERWTALPPNVPVSPSSLDMNRIYDTVIEVIDPVGRTVVATRRFDEPFIKVSGEGPMVSAQRTDADGYILWTISRLRVQRQNR